MLLLSLVVAAWASTKSHADAQAATTRDIREHQLATANEMKEHRQSMEKLYVDAQVAAIKDIVSLYPSGRMVGSSKKYGG